MNTATCIIGPSMVIKGDLTATEDVIIEGRVEGHVDLERHTLTVGPDAALTADVLAKVLTINGSVTGDVEAMEQANIRATATVTGTVAAPRVQMAPGASVQGRVDVRPATTPTLVTRNAATEAAGGQDTTSATPEDAPSTDRP